MAGPTPRSSLPERASSPRRTSVPPLYGTPLPPAQFARHSPLFGEQEDLSFGTLSSPAHSSLPRRSASPDLASVADLQGQFQQADEDVAALADMQEQFQQADEHAAALAMSPGISQQPILAGSPAATSTISESPSTTDGKSGPQANRQEPGPPVRPSTSPWPSPIRTPPLNTDTAEIPTARTSRFAKQQPIFDDQVLPAPSPSRIPKPQALHGSFLPSSTSETERENADTFNPPLLHRRSQSPGPRLQTSDRHHSSWYPLFAAQISNDVELWDRESLEEVRRNPMSYLFGIEVLSPISLNNIITAATRADCFGPISTHGARTLCGAYQYSMLLKQRQVGDAFRRRIMAVFFFDIFWRHFPFADGARHHVSARQIDEVFGRMRSVTFRGQQQQQQQQQQLKFNDDARWTQVNKDLSKFVMLGKKLISFVKALSEAGGPTEQLGLGVLFFLPEVSDSFFLTVWTYSGRWHDAAVQYLTEEIGLLHHARASGGDSVAVAVRAELMAAFDRDAWFTYIAE